MGLGRTEISAPAGLVVVVATARVTGRRGRFERRAPLVGEEPLEAAVHASAAVVGDRAVVLLLPRAVVHVRRRDPDRSRGRSTGAGVRGGEDRVLRVHDAGVVVGEARPVAGLVMER